MTERVLGAGRDRVKEFPGPSPLFSWAHSCISILLPNLQHTSAFPEFQKKQSVLNNTELCFSLKPKRKYMWTGLSHHGDPSNL